MPAAIQNWRYFIFSWAWPVLLYACVAVLSRVGALSGVMFAGFLVFALTSFALFAWLASAPYRRRTVSAGVAAFWIVIVPLVIYFALGVALPFDWRISLNLPTLSN
jgi:hypothetical protein